MHGGKTGFKMRLFGWFRKEPTKRKETVVAKAAVWQVDVYTKDGVFPEKFYEGLYSNCWVNDGRLIIRNIDNETVVYNMNIIERYICVEIEPKTTRELIEV